MQKKQTPQKIENTAQKGQPQQIKVTSENSGMLSVHFLQQIYARLGYIIKLLEKKKEN